jgi:hypothetical protein
MTSPYCGQGGQACCYNSAQPLCSQDAKCFDADGTYSPSGPGTCLVEKKMGQELVSERTEICEKGSEAKQVSEAMMTYCFPPNWEPEGPEISGIWPFGGCKDSRFPQEVCIIEAGPLKKPKCSDGQVGDRCANDHDCKSNTCLFWNSHGEKVVNTCGWCVA